MARRIEILGHFTYYRPELIGVGKYCGELCEWFARRGHGVSAICAPPHYPQWVVQPPYRQGLYRREHLQGVKITRCPIWVPKSCKGLRRVLYAASFAASSFPALLAAAKKRPDVIFVVEPTFFNAITSLIVARLCGAVGWLHIQDLEIDVAFETGQLRPKWLAGIGRAVEVAILKRFDVVSTVSGRMLSHLQRRGVTAEQSFLLPNWIDTTVVFPTQDVSPLRRELGLRDDATVVLFSGSVGPKQGVANLVEAARVIRQHEEIQIVICGEGPHLARLKALAADLPNVHFSHLQPADRINELLNIADLHVLPQQAEVADLVMPSKLIGMLASGRPVVATANPGTELADIVAQCGIVVEPGVPAALAAGIVHLASDRALRLRLGQAARNFALTHLSAEEILGRCEAFAIRAVERIKGCRHDVLSRS
jgi:colanic acid biosynthesis glycosyl transferase WcaI